MGFNCRFPLQFEYGEGNAFTGIYLSTRGCMQDAPPPPPLYAPHRMHPRPVDATHPRPTEDRRSTVGRYASYWNAFLFSLVL